MAAVVYIEQRTTEAGARCLTPEYSRSACRVVVAQGADNRTPVNEFRVEGMARGLSMATFCIVAHRVAVAFNGIVHRAFTECPWQTSFPLTVLFFTNLR